MSAALAALAAGVGLSYNLALQLGLGVREIYRNMKPTPDYNLFQWLILFLTVPLVWILFSWGLAPLALGFVEYFLLFPLCVFILTSLEYFLPRIFRRRRTRPLLFSSATAYSGLALAASMLTLRAAFSFTEALLISFSFSAGGLFSHILCHAIYQRTQLEKKPPLLQGLPLALLSTGLLSLLFTCAASLLLK